MGQKKSKKKKFNILRRILRKKSGALLFLCFIAFVANGAYQIFKKPVEIVSFIYEGEATGIHKTWEKYEDSFKANSTHFLQPETLASIAQVESSGRMLATPEWSFDLRRSWKRLFAPSSTAVGLMQITQGHKTYVQNYCKKSSVNNKLCNKDSLWFRWWPSHSIKMSAIYIDKAIRGVLQREPKGISSLNLVKLAAVTHLCGEGKAKSFARSGYRFSEFKKCGSHNVSSYVNRVVNYYRKIRQI